MRKIRDAQSIIGMLEGGDAASDLGREITETLCYLRDMVHGRQKGEAKGSVTLTLEFAVDHNGGTEVEVKLASKRPAKPRGKSYYWTLPDGSLSTDHPQQVDMFSGPREVRETV